MKDQVMMKTEGAAGTAKKPGLETIELARKDKPDVRFTGRLLAEVDSDTEGRDGGRTNKGRWTRLQLWELESGAWVAASIGCSDKPGEIDIGDVEKIPTHVVVDEGTQDERLPAGDEERQRRVMEFFGWSWLAKKLAERMGWDVVETIE